MWISRQKLIWFEKYLICDVGNTVGGATSSLLRVFSMRSEEGAGFLHPKRPANNSEVNFKWTPAATQKLLMIHIKRESRGGGGQFQC